MIRPRLSDELRSRVGRHNWMDAVGLLWERDEVFMRLICRTALLLMLVAPGMGAAEIPFERRLPPETLIAALTDDAATFVRLWGQTQYPAFANDPSMAPFIADVDGQLRQRPVLTGAMGLTWQDIKAVVSGPAAAALVQTQPHATGMLALIDTSGRGVQRTLLMAKVVKSVIDHHGRRETEKIRDEAVQVLVIPVDDDSRTVRVYVLVKDSILILADDRTLIEGILNRWDGKSHSLADRKDFQSVLKRAAFPDGKKSHLAAFVDAAASAAFTSRPPASKTPPGLFKIMNEEGLSQVKTIGGAARIGDGPFDVVLRVAVDAPSPYEKVMKLFHLRNTTRLEPEPLIPGWSTRCLTLSLNMPDVLSALSSVFDHVSGKSGDLDAVVDALRDDPEGPKADIRRDLIDNLTGRLFVVGAGPASGREEAGRSLLAFKCRDEKRLNECVGRLMANDDTIHSLTIGGVSGWRIAPSGKRASYEVKPLPTIVAVAKGYLLIANDEDLMQSILIGSSGPLTDDPAYRRVDAELKSLQPGAASMRLFARPSEGLRGLYELAQRGRLEWSPSLSAGAARGLQERLKWDVKKLPEFDKVNHCLQPCGGVAVSSDDGSDIILFSLKPPEQAKPVGKK